MYDDHDLKLSEFYFFLHNILRFAEDWSQRTTKNIYGLVALLTHFCIQNAQSPMAMWPEPDSSPHKLDCTVNFELNWRKVQARHGELQDQLLDKIGKLQERVKAVRDSVSPLTSIRGFRQTL